MISKYFKLLVFLTLFLQSCNQSQSYVLGQDYSLSYVNDKSKKVTANCFKFVKENTKTEIIHLNTNSESSSIYFDIQLSIDTTIKNDIEYTPTKKSILLAAKNEINLSWLFAQFIKYKSQVDSRLLIDSIPLIIKNFQTKGVYNFSFEYREPFFAENLVKNQHFLYGTNSIDVDWGIWGHNLGKIIRKKKCMNCLSSADENQICFTADATYHLIENYIIDNFGGGSSTAAQNFMIAPDDSPVSCCCSSCSKAGNTSKNATPALLKLVKAMALKFSNHNFFTIDYLSVQAPDNYDLPKNVGVFISTIDLPITPNFEQQNALLRNFEYKIEKWKKSVSKIYLWEYSINFDDYLTPFPNLLQFQKQLKYYKRLGVNGVFCNGSGYEYSTLEDLRTYIMSALMIDENLNVEEQMKEFLVKNYPSSGLIIFDYINGLEQKFSTSNASLNIYGGIEDSKKSFLNETEFFEFYSKLKEMLPRVKGQEKVKVTKLLTGLSFTHIQLKRAKNLQDFQESYQFLQENYSKFNITIFKEKNGTTVNYLNSLTLTMGKKKQNLLTSKNVTVLSKLDEDYTSLVPLVDGLIGMSTDYHNNWFFCSVEDLKLKIT